MKYVLFLLMMLASGISYSQDIKSLPGFKASKKAPGIRVLKDGTIIKSGLPNKVLALPSFSEPSRVIPKPEKFQSLPNGNMVYVLPQDHMPCVVPNLNASTPMPNLYGNLAVPYQYNGPDAIPNPASPIELIKPKNTIQNK